MYTCYKCLRQIEHTHKGLCQECYWSATLKGEISVDNFNKDFGYTKEFEAKLIRTKHKVTFATGTRAKSIVDMLSNFDGKVELDEIRYDDEVPNKISLIFHQEELEKL